ncbi:phosphotransferase enzyme family protein [Nocardiopsis lambiniae]|uniref:Phosphotransferase n=1 Tax=Nocardiopsis lambiniae TaxID=3075539 RepID=A0ABU2MC89_9ACTN|nr:phosphotransferase [Nocardiopsis sp. DSM 44743]MDT0330177.1 phosphotransferase [Nocardiopsis sp. DSM 44743]
MTPTTPPPHHATEETEVLYGGNTSGPVVRVGDTVRKQWHRAAPSVTHLLRHLNRHGYEAAPRSHGRSLTGDQLLEYVPGTLADRDAPLDTAELRRLGRLIRDLHDLTTAYRPRHPQQAVWDVALPDTRAEVLCHNDLAPWNLVRDGDRWVFIDWDGAGPGSRMGDLGYAAHGFVPLHPDGDPHADAVRLRALADGYGCDRAQRDELPDAIHHRVRGMYDLLVEGGRTGRAPWADLYARGHADHWGPAAEYVARHRDLWLTALLDEPVV